ncbi:hypothetical protein [Streptomyces flavalbus]|uniref:Secreted protein n=1 Tax=Streptomyces flavalbus TaxID=2665155 RepID=A0ABW2WE64_9ACTN
MRVPPSWLAAVTDSTLVPVGASTDGAEQEGGVVAEAPCVCAEAVGRHTAAASGTPAARTVSSRLMISHPEEK